MEQEVEYFKYTMKTIRGIDKPSYIAAICELASTGSYQGVEKYGNPQLITLLKLSKGLDIKFIIDNGQIEIV